MKMFFALALALSLVPLTADAQRRGEQDAAYAGRKSGALLPLRAIEGRVVPAMKARGADYIGAELDSDMARYRLKFVRDGAVIWVDVDGRSGAVVGRAGD
ncbi:MAG: hypothetical protein ACKVOP_05085 [Sphingomonadaceae bacterium]